MSSNQHGWEKKQNGIRVLGIEACLNVWLQTDSPKPFHPQERDNDNNPAAYAKGLLFDYRDLQPVFNCAEPDNPRTSEELDTHDGYIRTHDEDDSV